MNKARRDQISNQVIAVDNVIANVQEIIDEISDISSEICDIKDDEECAYDSLSESLQDSCKGQKMQQAVSTLETAECVAIGIESKCNCLIQDLEQIKSRLKEASI